MNYLSLFTACTICPRKCGVNRLEGKLGFCGEPAEIYAARAALHFWEEPCISGTSGSGTVFFSGCNLGCVFCQNFEIATQRAGSPVSSERLAEIYLELQEKGAHNINLVTPTHYLPRIVESLENAKRQGLTLPIVYNTSGYEEVASLRLLEGLIDIYLPDLKYISPDLSGRLSHCPDYFEKASLALQEMYRQTGDPILEEESGLMKKGMIVRHLLLPGQVGEAKRILRFLHNTFGDHIFVSIMSQYTPMPQVMKDPRYADIARKVTPEEYARVLTFAEAIGVELGFCQEGGVAKESFIPPFTGEGLSS